MSISMRMNVGFKNSQIIARITSESKEQTISKSQFIENTITAYFKNHQNDEVKLGIGRSTRKSTRLQITFKNKNLISVITDYAKKYTLSKSKLIEYILEKHFDIQNNAETKQYFNSNIFSNVIFCEGEGRKGYKVLGFDESNLDFRIKSRSLSLADLNKCYQKEIKIQLLFNPELNSKKIEINGFCYIVLVNEVKLTGRSLIHQGIDGANQINKNEYIYHFEINYRTLKIAKIIRDTTNNRGQLNMLLFDGNGFVGRQLKFIDLASIEYVSKKRAKNYKLKPNYECILPKMINRMGYYCIKLLDKPKAVGQFLKKEHIFKVDKKFILSQMPNANIKDLDQLGDKVSIVNILPIYEYTIALRC